WELTRNKTFVRAAAVVASGVVVAATLMTGTSPAGTAPVAPKAHTQKAISRMLPAGHRVNPKSIPVLSAAARATATAAAKAESLRRPFPGPDWVTRQASGTKSSSAASLGKATTPTTPNALPISTFRNTVIPTSGVTSTVSEPSTDQSGKNIMETSNWTAQYSHDNAATWTSLDPFTIFGSGFCCDQVTAYDPGRDRQYWLLQYGDHLTIANSPAGDLSAASWCYYSINPTLVGRPATDEFDYNDIAIGTNYLYLSTNMFDPNNFSGTAVLRFSLDLMTSCSGLTVPSFVRTDLFTLKLAQGVSDVMYAASDAPNGLVGNTLRIVTWDDASGTISTFDKAILPFAYMSVNSGQQCGSADLVVNNWCQRTDSRVLGAAKGGGKIHFSWNVKQGAAGRPFPYTREITLAESNLAIQTQRDLFGNSLAHLYVSMSPDRRGHIGYVDTFGGGTGVSHTFPGILVGIVDDATPFFPGDVSFLLAGSGGGCDAGGIFRWGDYTTARGGYTGAGVWTVTSWYRTENSVVSCGTPVPISLRSIVIGRARDLPAYNRWYGL
ncbi:MAG: hypothetical protein M3O55_02475, partial [Actinomycetota bacterium]|nr:hypothetical protein [Actinomycetota bacterium]